MTVEEQVRGIWPLLPVTDLPGTVAFWTERLGFSVVGKAESDDGVFWCRLAREGASLMLQQVDAGTDGRTVGGISLYFVCADVGALHDEFSSRGLELDAPSEAYYGMLQLFIPEPNGYDVCFESPTDNWHG